MCKASLIFLLLLFGAACSKEKEKPVVTDDYVLIEFAARLEEEKQSTLTKPEVHDATH